MDYLSVIKHPIESDFQEFVYRFQSSLSHSYGLLSQALEHIRQRTGKQMRPMLTLLSAKNYGEVSDVTLDAAVSLELLHTASLIHDDVVDESSERRGQSSVNASYNNKVAVLVGDYILSICLSYVAKTKDHRVLQYVADLGMTLASGELLQMQNINNAEFSEDVYYQVIRQKTAALFETCCGLGSLSVNASEEEIKKAKQFGQDLGMIFQIGHISLLEFWFDARIDISLGLLRVSLHHPFSILDTPTLLGKLHRHSDFIGIDRA